MEALLLLLLLSLCSAAAARPPSELNLQSAFSPSNASSLLLSAPNGIFAFGFTKLQQNQFYLAIWYSSLDNRVVWIANSDHPASAAAYLAFTSNGDWQLRASYSDSVDVLWKSGTPSMGVHAAQLQDSGNLVLVNSSGIAVWQSFDYPTDTLLPTQWLQFNKELISRKNRFTAASGVFQLTFEQDGTASLFRSDYGQQYMSFVPGKLLSDNSLSSPQPAGSVQLDASGIVFFYNITRTDYNFFYPLDIGKTPNPTRRVTLDVDGNLRTYSWEDSSRSWVMVWQALQDPCINVPNLCGDFGICIYHPTPTCICPPGFHIADSNDITEGCTPNVPIAKDSCTLNTNIQFVKLPNIDYPINDLVSSPYKSLISLTDCLYACQNNCLCVLAVFDYGGQNKCWLKYAAQNGQQKMAAYSTFLKLSRSDNTVTKSTSQENSSIIQWSTDASYWSIEGNSSLEGNQSLSPSPNACEEDGRSLSPKHKDCAEKDTAVIITISIFALGELICLVIALWLLRKLKQGSGRSVSSSNTMGSAICFRLKDLETATNAFSNKLGDGAFGTVFSGRIADGRMVAVKYLEGVSRAENQFKAEIMTLGKIHHINLVRLHGFCAEGNQRLLVYELMENGSLDAFLFGKRSETGERIKTAELNWKTRFAICLGIARGISYLHDECLDCILHCDIKPQNILLDKYFCPKVGDFGLSYLFNREVKLQVSAIHGTRGYLAPEWLANLPITCKADVFSFGMLLIEILSGRQNYQFTESAITSSGWFFPEWAFQRLNAGKEEDVLDASLRGDADFVEAKRVLSVAFLCIQRDPQYRPFMRSVVQMLEGTLAIPDLPPAGQLFEQQHPWPALQRSGEPHGLLGSSSTLVVSAENRHRP